MKEGQRRQIRFQRIYKEKSREEKIFPEEGSKEENEDAGKVSPSSQDSMQRGSNECWED